MPAWGNSQRTRAYCCKDECLLYVNACIGKDPKEYSYGVAIRGRCQRDDEYCAVAMVRDRDARRAGASK